VLTGAAQRPWPVSASLSSLLKPGAVELRTFSLRYSLSTTLAWPGSMAMAEHGSARPICDNYGMALLSFIPRCGGHTNE
jgi:hypothetical protein